MPLARRLLLATPLWLAACGDDGLPRSFAPLRYDYLTRLQINVASIDTADLPPPGALDQISPAPLAPALRQMALDRLTAGGSSGHGLVTVEEARITRGGGGLDGAMALRLDILAADGTKVGFAEARVARHVATGGSLQANLYDITKAMLDDMNVEFEFQVRQSLRDYLQTTTTAPAPAPVQQENLSAPPS